MSTISYEFCDWVIERIAQNLVPGITSDKVFDVRKRDLGQSIKIALNKGLGVCIVVELGSISPQGNAPDDTQVNIEVNGGASLPALIARPAFWDEGKDTLVHVELRDTEGNLLSENFYQYWKDSELEYEKPSLTVEKLDEYSFAITTDTYTKNIFIEAHDNEAVLSDNYFHLLKGQRKVVTATAKLDFDKMEIRTLNEVER